MSSHVFAALVVMLSLLAIVLLLRALRAWRNRRRAGLRVGWDGPHGSHRARVARSAQVTPTPPADDVSSDGAPSLTVRRPQDALEAQLRRIEALQPVDEEQALAHAMEASISTRGGEAESDEQQQQRQQRSKEESAMQKALEDSIVSTLLALPTQPWSVASAAKRQKARADDDAMCEDEECAMCMEPFAPADEVRVLKCGHYFHTKCIDQWLLVGQQGKSRSCPVCQDSPV